MQKLALRTYASFRHKVLAVRHGNSETTLPATLVNSSSICACCSTLRGKSYYVLSSDSPTLSSSAAASSS